MADSTTKNVPEKLFVTHAFKLKTRENLINQREDVRANEHPIVRLSSDDVISSAD